MLTFRRGLVAILAVFGLASAGLAQAPDPLLGVPPAARATDPLLTPTQLPSCPPLEPPADHWRFAVDFGLPMGVRVQRRLGESNFWGEAGVGVWAFVPYASLCLRYDVCALRRERNLFAVRPGVSITGPLPAAGVDCEFIWQHCWNGTTNTELGLRLGASAVFLGNGNRWANGVFPAPVACLTFAWQF